ncbi:transport 80 homolog [Octopus vulgaris]|uniref:Transport 80 homolog n=1 Tax=Octopus vulgaris TaxID=6645 RepID=A0AA36FFY9_OCTVU|nr:transport 80 homolog [Octopus vulgaris]
MHNRISYKVVMEFELVSCVCWTSPEEVYSAADDHQILKWNLNLNESSKFVTLPDGVYPTSLLWTPKDAGSGKKVGSDTFVLTSTDGKIHYISKSGRLEKSIEAHKGAILCGSWSHNGEDFATAGEDGQVKIWSKQRMLRSTLVQNSAPIYSLAWAPDSKQLVFTNGKQLILKAQQAGSKPFMWKGHDGLILVLQWNAINDLILSGGEDCKYKIWNSYGVIMYSSAAYDYPITSLAWNPSGELFVVGSFSSLRLCDRSGWSYALEKPNTGSIFCLAWSTDGTQVSGACGIGQVIIGHLVDRRLEWKNFVITVVSSNQIDVHNVLDDVKEKLDFRDRIIKLSFSFGYLVVATASQGHIYSTKNWNTPIIFDLKDGCVSLIVQAEKYFLLADGANLSILSYDGRVLSPIKFPGLKSELLTQVTVSLSNDTLAVRSKNDEKVIHLFEVSTGKPVGDGKPICHKLEVVEIALDQCGHANERRLAIVDRNRDLYLTTVRLFGHTRTFLKLGSMVQSLSWNDSCNMLATLSDDRFLIYYYPNAIYVDKDLLPEVIEEKDTSEYGKNPQILQFLGNQVVMRRSEGSLVSSSIKPYPMLLHGYVNGGKWEEAVRLCRFVKEDKIWACLAGMAAYAKELPTAEVAYAALKKADKIQYIARIKDIPIKEARKAEMALFCGNIQDAEAILLQAGLIFRAVILNVKMFNWERSLELAVKHKTHVDTVLAYRQKYLQNFNKTETNKKFLQYMETMEVEWEQVQAKIAKEYQQEKERSPAVASSRMK